MRIRCVYTPQAAVDKFSARRIAPIGEIINQAASLFAELKGVLVRKSVALPGPRSIAAVGLAFQARVRGAIEPATSF
jgi:hypothetical protein